MGHGQRNPVAKELNYKRHSDYRQRVVNPKNKAPKRASQHQLLEDYADELEEFDTDSYVIVGSFEHWLNGGKWEDDYGD